jgi:hypothetical protein
MMSNRCRALVEIRRAAWNTVTTSSKWLAPSVTFASACWNRSIQAARSTWPPFMFSQSAIRC